MLYLLLPNKPDHHAWILFYLRDEGFVIDYTMLRIVNHVQYSPP